MQLAYLGLQPKSFHTIKYSQPFELVLFHVITIHIKCHKDSYYPHLLNNYLFNYLNFSDLTLSTGTAPKSARRIVLSGSLVLNAQNCEKNSVECWLSDV